VENLLQIKEENLRAGHAREPAVQRVPLPTPRPRPARRRARIHQARRGQPRPGERIGFRGGLAGGDNPCAQAGQMAGGHGDRQVTAAGHPDGADPRQIG
jgi:hypothetical protein